MRLGTMYYGVRMHPCINWFILIYRRGPTSYVKSITNSAIEIGRIKSLEDGVGPVSIVRIDLTFIIMLKLKVMFQAKLLFSDPIRNGIIMHQIAKTICVIIHTWCNNFLISERAKPCFGGKARRIYYYPLNSMRRSHDSIYVLQYSYSHLPTWKLFNGYRHQHEPTSYFVSSTSQVLIWGSVKQSRESFDTLLLSNSFSYAC